MPILRPSLFARNGRAPRAPRPLARLAALLIASCIAAIARADAAPALAAPPAQADLSGPLTLHVTGLTPAEAARLRLRLGGHVFSALAPRTPSQGVLVFDLGRLRSDHDGWLALAAAPPPGGHRRVELALVAPDGTELAPAPSPATASAIPNALTAAEPPPPIIDLVLFRWWSAVAGAAFALALIAATLWLARNTDALRDAAAPLPPPGQRRQYSFGRCQMAFWFVLITASFVLIALMTGDANGIVSSQSCSLLGISGATAIGAASMDSVKQAAGGPAYAARITPHSNFWADLLKDSTGWAFHRLQALVWTLLLGAIAVISVYQRLTLPSFDPNLLILMGVSSGLYLGFKFPEQPS